MENRCCGGSALICLAYRQRNSFGHGSSNPQVLKPVMQSSTKCSNHAVFAERFARHWLDLARYAESLTLRGFILPDAWRYRDYCIDSFAEDKPIDQFLREQVAGDLMAIDTKSQSTIAQRQSQQVAAMFLLLGNHNLEEQDKQQLEMDVVDEQLDTLGKVVLGQTLDARGATTTSLIRFLRATITRWLASSKARACCNTKMSPNGSSVLCRSAKQKQLSLQLWNRKRPPFRSRSPIFRNSNRQCRALSIPAH